MFATDLEAECLIYVPYEQGAIRVSERSSIQLWSEAVGNLQDWSTFPIATRRCATVPPSQIRPDGRYQAIPAPAETVLCMICAAVPQSPSRPTLRRRAHACLPELAPIYSRRGRHTNGSARCHGRFPRHNER